VNGKYQFHLEWVIGKNVVNLTKGIKENIVLTDLHTNQNVYSTDYPYIYWSPNKIVYSGITFRR